MVEFHASLLPESIQYIKEAVREQQAVSTQALQEQQEAVSSPENAASRRVLPSDYISTVLGQPEPEVSAGAASQPATVLPSAPPNNNRRKLSNSRSISVNNLPFENLDLGANESTIHTGRVARHPNSSAPLHGPREGSVPEPLLPSARSLDAAATQYEEALPTPAKLISEFDSLAGGYSHDSFARRQGQLYG